jgi:hypothetical protein
MKKPSFATGILAFGLLFSSHVAFAHHGNAAYNFSKTATLDGTITDFEWSNPHCLVHLDVMGNDGNIQHWTLELPSIFTMEHKGWTKDSLKRGDHVVAETHPAKNGAPIGISWMGTSVMKLVANGKELPTR